MTALASNLRWGLRTAIATAHRTVAIALLLAGCVATPLLVQARAEVARANAAELLQQPQFRTLTVTQADDAAIQPSLTRQLAAVWRGSESVVALRAFGRIADVRPAEGWPNTRRIPMVERLVVSAEVPASTCGTVAIGRGTYDVHRAWTLHLADAASYFPVTRILPPEHRLSFGAEAERTVCDWAHAQRLILLLHDADDLQIVANAFTRTVPGARVDLPEGVAALRQELDTTLSDTTRALSLTVLAAGSFIVAALAATNARDEARHMARSRALGATKGDLAAMLAAQTLAPVALGVLVGLAVAGATAAVWRVRLGADVYLAVSALMALSSGSVTALVVAWAASRDPAARLRIP